MSPARPVVAVCHPERQHSHRLASALDQAGLLCSYLSGAAVPADTPIDSARHSQLPATMQFRRLATRVRPVRLSRFLVNTSYAWFDARARRRLQKDAEVVVGYEAACLSLFREARKAGKYCVLDAASLDAATQKRWLPNSNPAPLFERKRAEVECADMILTCSELAAQSYRDAWPGKRVEVLTLGADLDHFPAAGDDEVRPDRLQALFVGHVTHTKGADLLAAAMNQLAARGVAIDLSVVANRATAQPEIWADLPRHARMEPAMNRTALARAMRGADLLILPSRIESFGLVVVEALASGTPVILSSQVGARDLVADDQNGWIVPAGDADALAERLAWAAEHLSHLRTMRAQARLSVAACSWQSYSDRAVAIFREIVRDRRLPEQG